MSHIHWVVWGTGTPKDRDEVNRREFWVCDGWVCDLEAIGDPLIFKLIRSATTLVRMSSTLDLNCEENTSRRKWKLVCDSWTPETGRKWSGSRCVCTNRRHTSSPWRRPDVLKICQQESYLVEHLKIETRLMGESFECVMGDIYTQTQKVEPRGLV